MNKKIARFGKIGKRARDLKMGFFGILVLCLVGMGIWIKESRSKVEINEVGTTILEDGSEVITGTFVITYRDNFARHTASTEYSLIVDKNQELTIVNPSPELLKMKAGSTVRLVGESGEKTFKLNLKSAKYKGGVQLVSPATTRSGATGEKKIAVILAQFPDLPGQQDLSLSSVISTYANEVKNTLLENSFNQLVTSADVQGWYTYPMAATCDETKIEEMAVTIADGDFYYPDYDYIHLIVPYNVKCPNIYGYASWVDIETADGEISKPLMVLANDSNGGFDWMSVDHELAHDLGANHGNGLNCQQNQFAHDGSCTNVEYGNIYDLMGDFYYFRPQFGAYWKNNFGWLKPENVVTVPNETEGVMYTLAPTEAATNGVQMLVVPIGETGAAYEIENREGIGSDINLPFEAIDGAIVNVIKPSKSNNSYLVDMFPDSRNEQGERWDFSDAALPIGQTFNDEENGITITAMYNEGRDLVVWVKRNDPYRDAPTFSALQGLLKIGTDNVGVSTFTFDYADGLGMPGNIVNMSTDPNMVDDVYYYFAEGAGSPIVEPNSTKWDKFSCGRVMYWDLYNEFTETRSDVVENTVVCDKPIETATYYSKAVEDGWVLEISRTGEVGGTLNSTANGISIGDSALKQQYRSFLSFDTRSIPDNANVVSATLQLKKTTGSGNPASLGKLVTDIRRGSFSNDAALTIGDWKSAATALNVGSFNTITNEVTLNETGLRSINKAGLTQLRLRFGIADNGDSKADVMKFFSGNTTTEAWKPKLTIKYQLMTSSKDVLPYPTEEL